MKLLLIGDYPPPYGGISVHVQQLSDFVRRQGASCSVLDIEPGSDPKPGAIRVTGAFGFLSTLILFSWRGYVSHIHTNGHNFKSWLAIAVTAWVGFFFGRRNIATLHSGLMPEYAAGGRGRRWIIRLAVQPLGGVIAVNRKIERTLLEMRVAPSRISVLPAFTLGPRAGVVPEWAGDYRKHFSPLIVSAVYLEKEYGTDLLVKACVALRSKYPRLGCLIMGSGSEETAIRSLIRVQKGEDVLFLVGNVPHDLCLSLMEQSDLFVRPTLFDGDAISVREALALGVPTVASDVGFRPPGARLFKPGDVADLVFQIDRALQEGQPPAASEESPENLVLLRGVYERVVKERR
jgi:glycosyltransferase involved in cell wall biosynthesis